MSVDYSTAAGAGVTGTRSARAGRLVIAHLVRRAIITRLQNVSIKNIVFGIQKYISLARRDATPNKINTGCC